MDARCPGAPDGAPAQLPTQDGERAIRGVVADPVAAVSAEKRLIPTGPAVASFPLERVARSGGSGGVQGDESHPATLTGAEGVKWFV